MIITYAHLSPDLGNETERSIKYLLDFRNDFSHAENNSTPRNRARFSSSKINNPLFKNIITSLKIDRDQDPITIT